MLSERRRARRHRARQGAIKMEWYKWVIIAVIILYLIKIYHGLVIMQDNLTNEIRNAKNEIKKAIETLKTENNSVNEKEKE